MAAGAIKIGLVGLGRAGWGMHCHELEKRQNLFQIAAVCDAIPERMELAKSKYGCKTYDSIQKLVKDKDVELVDIATRSLDHVAHAKIALKAGKFVFLEKPIAINAKHLRALKKLVAQYPGKLYFRHNRRFEDAFVKIRQMLNDGLIGSVSEIKLRRNNYGRRDDWQAMTEFGGGQLNNWGPHIIDHSLRLLESPVVSMFSDLKLSTAVGDAEDTLKIVFKGANGRVVDMEITGGAAISEPEYLILGSKGAITCTGTEIKIKRLDPKVALPAKKASGQTPPASGPFGTPDNFVWLEETVKAKGDEDDLNAGTHSIWNHLYAAIRDGKPFPITNEEAFGVIEVICKVKKGTPFER